MQTTGTAGGCDGNEKLRVLLVGVYFSAAPLVKRLPGYAVKRAEDIKSVFDCFAAA
ncbi:MAG: hypothetical protein Q4G07_10330 [Oscillospiraceae bacterium]|nr:hypothetical protein [Oscillospiraceae bacterium]